MKVIGLLGGTSWPSTIEYYRLLNETVQTRLGGYHSANLLLRSIDYHSIKSRYHHGWDEIPSLLSAALTDLADRGPDCILLCNNTLHKAYDQLLSAGLELPVPVFHIVDAVSRAAKAKDYRRLLLLGTKFSMEDGFYSERLARDGLHVSTPDAAEREKIQDIQSRLAAGQMDSRFRAYFKSLLSRYDSVDAVVLGCTELPLAIGEDEASQAILNPIELQCEEALEFALAGHV